jgi:hypothetical protein|tara:strand:+ start:332 stop:475 length:144 start_codon:yes stop_codon:yes gene_type:complete
MTKFEFDLICGELLIDADVALEDNDIREMLIDRVTPKEMKKYMERNF